MERQVGVVRQRIFAKRRKFTDLDELNQWLRDESQTMAATQKHPEFTEQTVAEVASIEQASLVPVPTLFDAYQESTARVSRTALINFDRNRYSVQVSAIGKTVTVRAYANRISMVHNGELIGLHCRQFSRDRTTYEPWHYLAVLKQKPGALRNGAPFQQWDLPEPLKKARERLGFSSDGDRQFVGILAAVPDYGLDAVAAACTEALSARTISRDLVLNILSRASEPEPVANCQPPAHLPKLKLLPTADCGRYDGLLIGGGHAS